MKKLLAPLLIFVISYLIKNKTDLRKVRTFYESHSAIPRSLCPEGMDLVLKHLEEAENEKSSNDTLKRIGKLQWTIEISRYSANRLFLYLEMN